MTDLEQMARRIRRHVIETVAAVGGGHLGGSLSAADILSVLYFHLLRIDPQRPDWPERDRFILSKGHASLALYAALAERGYFRVDELATYGALGTRLQAHPDLRKAPGVDMSTGSLGQGLSAGVGMALGARLQGLSWHTYVLLGDGEAAEGQVYEAAMLAGVQGLANLTAILDYNKLSQTGATEPFQGDVAARWRSFGWDVAEVNGHDTSELTTALQRRTGRPQMLIAHTIKGKGVSFMEGRSEFHSASLTAEQAAAALAELEVAP